MSLGSGLGGLVPLSVFFPCPGCICNVISPLPSLGDMFLHLPHHGELCPSGIVSQKEPFLF